MRRHLTRFVLFGLLSSLSVLQPGFAHAEEAEHETRRINLPNDRLYAIAGLVTNSKQTILATNYEKKGINESMLFVRDKTGAWKVLKQLTEQCACVGISGEKDITHVVYGKKTADYHYRLCYTTYSNSRWGKEINLGFIGSTHILSMAVSNQIICLTWIEEVFSRSLISEWYDFKVHLLLYNLRNGMRIEHILTPDEPNTDGLYSSVFSNGSNFIVAACEYHSETTNLIKTTPESSIIRYYSIDWQGNTIYSRGYPSGKRGSGLFSAGKTYFVFDTIDQKIYITLYKGGQPAEKIFVGQGHNPHIVAGGPDVIDIFWEGGLGEHKVLVHRRLRQGRISEIVNMIRNIGDNFADKDFGHSFLVAPLDNGKSSLVIWEDRGILYESKVL